MFLTKEEEAILNGEKGFWEEKALKLLVKLGELSGAERLVEIKRSHLSGVSYKTVGEPILELLEDMANSGVKVKTFATLNPSGIDVRNWEKIGFPRDFVERQLRIIKAFKKMGVRLSLTCTPYLFENKPKNGEIVAFAESSAIVYVNSIIGAKTNRHGNLDALAASIIGKVPYTGLLIDENRKADVKVKVMLNELRDEYFSLLGLYIGDKLNSNEIPLFVFDNYSTLDEIYLRSLGAALASSGGIPLFHVLGMTPEAKSFSSEKEIYKDRKPADILNVDVKDLLEFKNKIVDEIDDPDLIAIGCPHASLEEIKILAELVKGKRLKNNKRFWVFTSRFVKEKADELGLTHLLEKAGIQLLTDTCMVVSPLEEMGIRFVITNSGKASFYIPKLSKNSIKASLYSLEKIINEMFI